MTEQPNRQPTSRQPKRTGGESIYLVVVAGLLVLIIALLASLWLRERSARLAAERELVEYRHRVVRMENILQALVLEQAAERSEEPVEE